MSAGFYTTDLRYASNAVYAPGFTLLASEKDTYVYPVNGWTWYDSRDQAVAASLAVNENDPIEIEKRRLSLVIQEVLDAEARLRNFDNIFTAVTYEDDPNPTFSGYATQLKAWRSAVWTKAYEVMGQVLASQISQPTDQELLAMLPNVNDFPQTPSRRR
jgi:hypothetical protein